MHGLRRTLIAVCALGGLMRADLAVAADRAQGWANWVDRAQSIDEAMNSEHTFKLKAACEGVFGTISRQGFVFPRWAQEIDTLCRSMLTWEAASRSVDEIKRANRRWCGSIKDIAAQMARAEPVPEAPRAQPLALRMARELAATHAKLCK